MESFMANRQSQKHLQLLHVHCGFENPPSLSWAIFNFIVFLYENTLTFWYFKQKSPLWSGSRITCDALNLCNRPTIIRTLYWLAVVYLVHGKKWDFNNLLKQASLMKPIHLTNNKISLKVWLCKLTNFSYNVFFSGRILSMKKSPSQVQWLTSVILATGEVKIKRIIVQGHPKQKSKDDPNSTNKSWACGALLLSQIWRKLI
jgi:hypothetical protein